MLSVLDTHLGTFKNYHTHFRNSLAANDVNSFSSLLNDVDRFSFVFRYPAVHKYEITTTGTIKNIDLSKQYKEEGNKAFQSGKYNVALHFYSRAILEHPQQNPCEKDEQLSILFANRSAALYHLEKFQLALQDIKLALENGYPKDISYKIYDRKARCFLALKQLKDAREAFRKTLPALDDSKLTLEKRQKLQKDVQIMLAMFDKHKVLTNANLPRDTSSELPPLTDGQNSYYHSASSVVDVKETPEFGRYAVASRDIKVGEVLLTEKPYCAVLLAEYSKTHCFNCFKRAIAPLPCPQCNNVLFCGVECQEEAMTTHHKTECSILNTLWKSGASITCLMALRIITQSGLDFFLNMKSTLQVKPEICDQFYRNTDYMTIYNLVGHDNRRSTEDFLHRTHMATFLLRCLKETSFFGNESLNSKLKAADGRYSLTEAETFIGSLILRHLQVLQFNAHEVAELIVQKFSQSSRSQFIGGAVYPTLALFNHSCNPGIVRYYKGTKVVVRAIRKTKRGEMIAENYGPIFTQVTRDKRLDTCRNQYWFDCTCQACVEDWPTFDKMDNGGNIRFQCESANCDNIIVVPVNTMQFMVQCNQCGQHTNILKGLKALQDTDVMFRIAQSLQNNEEYSKALTKYMELLGLLDETLAPPFRDYHLCQEAIRFCMLHLGNVYKDQ